MWLGCLRFQACLEFCNRSRKNHGPGYTKSDGTPNGNEIFRSDFYDDRVAGIDRVMSTGAIISSPVVDGNVVLVGKRGWKFVCAEVENFCD